MADPSEYYDNSDPAQRYLTGETARGSDIDAKFDAVQAAMEKLPSPNGTENGFDSILKILDAVDDEDAVTLGQLKAWEQAINANGQRLTGLPDPAADGEPGTKSWIEAFVAAYVQGGGSPGDIPITGLGVGAGTARQLLAISPDGLSVVGADEYWNDRNIAEDAALANRDRCYVDASTGPHALTLPPAPTEDARIRLTVKGANNPILARNGSTIEAAAEDMTIDNERITFDVVFRSGTWSVE
ncbi:hypothetical protein [Pontibacterium sp.]|uniref:hypothetical protein n=1 Tax=Pontibacterium sp. TaxID=2036026 RepID=UPI003562FA55